MPLTEVRLMAMELMEGKAFHLRNWSESLQTKHKLGFEFRCRQASKKVVLGGEITQWWRS